MAGNVQADERARMSLVPLTGHLINDRRLGPGEAHALVRLQVEKLAPSLDISTSDSYWFGRQLYQHRYAAGEIILPRRARADCMGLIVQGQVAVLPDQRGFSRPTAVLLPGSTFGQAMLLEGRPSGSTLQALTRCELWLLRRSDLQTLVGRNRAARRATRTKRTIAMTAALLVLCSILVALVVFASNLPSTREALALLSLRGGEWCYRRIPEGSPYEVCAEEAWQVAARLAPSDPNPLVALGGLYRQQGDSNRAEEVLTAALNLYAQAALPSSAHVYNGLGQIYASRGEHEQAIAAFRRARELEPGVASTEHNLGRSLQAIGAYEEALQHYQLALLLDEPQASTLVNMAVAYYETGQMAEAAFAAREALKYDESLVTAYTVLGAVALQSWQPKDALPALRRATELDADYFQAQFYLGQAYRALGQSTEAIAAFEQALLMTENPGLRREIRRYLDELRQDVNPH